MSNEIRDIVSALSHEQRVQIIQECEQFEKDGVLGASLLRTTAEQYCERLGVRISPIMVMDALVRECYRHYAFRYLALCPQI